MSITNAQNRFVFAPTKASTDAPASINISVKDIKLCDFGHSSTMLICGKRGTGKSPLIKNILSNFDPLTNLYVFHSGHHEDFDDLTKHVYETTDRNSTIEKIGSILDYHRYNKGQIKSIIVLETIETYRKEFWQTSTMREIYHCGRALGITLICALQSIISIPPELRQNIDHIFLTRGTLPSGDKQKLFSYFFSDLPHFHLFNSAIDGIPMGACFHKDMTTLNPDNAHTLSYIKFGFDFRKIRFATSLLESESVKSELESFINDNKKERILQQLRQVKKLLEEIELSI